MLIYILHNDQLYKFSLPKKVFGIFALHDYDKNGIKRNLLNIHANNSQWVINSNDNAKIKLNNEIVQGAVLQEYHFYNLVVGQNEQVVLYVAPGYDTTYQTRKMPGEDSIYVGSDTSCEIVFSFQYIQSKQLQLDYKAGRWTVKNLNEKVPLYVNGKNVNNAILSNFDSIFLMGLRIVVCGDLLFINNPFTKVAISDKLAVSVGEVGTADYKSDNQSFIDFYESSDYFSKSPVFTKKFHTLKMPITSPEDKEKDSSASLIMSIVPSALMSMTSLVSTYFSISNYRSGQLDKEMFITSVIMCLVMLFISIVWPFVEKFVEKLRSFLKERKRIRLYNRYLKNKREVLDKARNEQKMSLEINNLSVEECQDIIRKKGANLFSVTGEQERFLQVKLGVGQVLLDCEIDYVKPDFIKVKDKLLDKIDKLIDDYKYIDEAPYSFSLKNNVAFINKSGYYDNYLKSIVLQLITFQDYYNLKLVILASENSSLSSLRNLNHCWNNERDMRYFANNMEDAETLSSHLVRIFNSRTDNGDNDGQRKDDSKIPFYLIITDDIEKFRNLKIIDKVLHQKEYSGFALTMFSLEITDIPDGCNYFIDFSDKQATLFQAEMEENSIMKFKPELINDKVDYEACVRAVANIPIKINNESSGVLPEKLGFLQMLNVGNIKQLNSVNRWNDAQIINSLAAPIGVDINGNILSLDLHEKKHGPHGLIAGMTGSGKSEFIITYILSLAVNYSPNEVQFVLIDYKGGGLAGAFENRKTGMKLPHLVGTITNLDVSSMNRTLVSIKSELQRRQRVFNEAKELLGTGTIDIYKYQKLVRDGSLKDPMSHLFIICDEFAELKAQQPDFMDELVSAARIGRSLGVHLILATQKPSGVVDDQIWSNAKFKVCCKVQTADDSKEMIRRDDAAYIKESGRFYLQVGYDEIFVKGQSAYTGTQYVPSETVNIGNGGKDSIEFLDNLGNVVKTVKKNNEVQNDKSSYGDELGNVINYLIECANQIGFKNTQLWLDNIPPQLYLYNVLKKYPMTTKKFIINPLIGEYDDPANQKQGPVCINLTEKGNLWVSGSYGGGKTTLLSTLIYSSIVNYNTAELNIYIIDMLAETLKMFSKAPQVGDFVSSSESDKINKLFHFLESEVTRRKKYFSDTGGVFASEAAKGKVPFPNILVVLNGMEPFIDQYDDLYNDLFSSLIRDCNRVGITFVVTSTGSMSVVVENSFNQKIALKYLDVTEYINIFNDTRGIVPASNPGRGLVELDQVYEFQTALIFDDVNFEYNLSYVIEQLTKYLHKAPGIPTMPRVVTYEYVKDSISSLDAVPVGVDVASNCVSTFDFSKLVNLVVYSNAQMAAAFVRALANVIKDINNTKVIVLDTLGIEDEIEGVQLYTSNFKKICLALYKNVGEKKSDNLSAEKIIFIISGYNKIEQHLRKAREEDETVKTIDDIIAEAMGAANYNFILVNDNKLASVDDKIWADYLESGEGIILSTELDEQQLIETEESYDTAKINKDTAIIVKDSKKSFAKFVRSRGQV